MVKMVEMLGTVLAVFMRQTSNRERKNCIGTPPSLITGQPLAGLLLVSAQYHP
jgi:hypothetical protein